MNYKKRLLERRAKEESKLDRDLITLTIIASLLAVFGIKTDNVYVTLGAMLVSPLFDPIISITVYYYTQNSKGLKQSLKSLFYVVSLAFITSGLAWEILFQLKDLHIYVYTSPSINIFDSLFIAILIGIVGSLMWIWPKTSNTTAGIAAAISLIPPITMSSGGIVLGDLRNSLQYFILFFINISGIFLGATGVFLVYFNQSKIRKFYKRFRV